MGESCSLGSEVRGPWLRRMHGLPALRRPPVSERVRRDPRRVSGFPLSRGFE
jgi:hypothetical protein